MTNHIANPATPDNIEPLDLFIVGGGINGVGVARDAAGRGLQVALCEKGDLAEGTSSRSGKLVHGGLRYLEYYEFRLVREALIEREVLLESAPHILWPMRFVLPHSRQHRPAWLIRLGLFLYDHLGGRKRLPATRVIKLRSAPEGESLLPALTKAFEYSDCWVDDARLVVLNAVDAASQGARIMTRTTFHSASRHNGMWQINLRDANHQPHTLYARALVNAAGPWVDSVIGNIDQVRSERRVRLVKGSHIIVKKFWRGDHAYLLQNADKRVIFVNPYEGDYALIGTTDIPQQGPAESAVVEQSEIDYLLDTINSYFTNKLSRADVTHSYTGVRPLYDDNAGNPSAVTRDYVFDLDCAPGNAPLISVFGGKITTYRKLSEHLLDKLQPFFPSMKERWTAKHPLPGGDIDNADFDQFLASVQQQYHWLEGTTVEHLARAYGTLLHQVLDKATAINELGRCFAPAFYECEARYLYTCEWARTAEDVLLRRTKHGLHMTEQQQQHFNQWWREFISSHAGDKTQPAQQAELATEESASHE